MITQTGALGSGEIYVRLKSRSVLGNGFYGRLKIVLEIPVQNTEQVLERGRKTFCWEQYVACTPKNNVEDGVESISKARITF